MSRFKFSTRFVNSHSYSKLSPVSSRKYVTLQAGSVSKPVEKTQPSVSSPTGIQTVDSDQTGLHKRVILTVCNRPVCPIQNCSITECPITNTPEITTPEDIGVLTHKVPPFLSGDKVSDTDFNGKAQPQYFVSETAVLPQGNRSFKPHEKATEFVQEDAVFKKIMEKVSEDSVYALKLKTYEESLTKSQKASNPAQNYSKTDNDD